MKNYFIKSVGQPDEPYPDARELEKQGRFKTLEEYRKIAKKVIRDVAKRKTSSRYVSIMVNSEDYVAEIAYQLMMADWNYQKNKSNGKTLYSWRNQKGIWAVHDCLNAAGNEQVKSLSDVSDLDEARPLSDFIQSHDELPLQTLRDKESDHRIKEYSHWLVENSGLTPAEKKCVELKYKEGVDTAAEVGQKLNPPITRQGAKQTLDRAVAKMKQTVFGTI